MFRTYTLLPFLTFWVVFSTTMSALCNPIEGLENNSATFVRRQRILAEIEARYQNILEKKGLIFKVQINLTAQTLSGSADFTGTSYNVVIDRPLLEYQNITDDGFRMLICHEIGHHFGGAPRKSQPTEWTGPIANSDGRTYLSSEGEADYYASRTCFPEVVKNQDHMSSLAGIKVPEALRKLCSATYQDPQQAALCIRSSLASFSLLTMSAGYQISFVQKDSSHLSKLLRDIYPERQCRLDTFLAGALCTDRKTAVWDFDIPANNECPDDSARRPRCWYAVEIEK